MLMKPDEIYWVGLATGRRPDVVVSRESLNDPAIGNVIDLDCEPN